uniref:8.9 kDa family member n=1 Tax=Rhipicephalus appendiculatus TaxID=34631 RepID=A0A131Z6I3_RHIAP
MPAFTVLVVALIVSTMVYCRVLESATIYLNRGHCRHRNGTIKNGETRNIKRPCARATCSGGNLVFQMCNLVTNTDDKCQVVKGKGRYPECCPRLYCS